jgi:protein-arginine kinase activator protein McsA
MSSTMNGRDVMSCQICKEEQASIHVEWLDHRKSFLSSHTEADICNECCDKLEELEYIELLTGSEIV